MTAPAVRRGQALGNGEAVMLVPFLVAGGLVTLEATDVFLRMHAHLVFVHDAVLEPVMTLGALARRADQRGIRLGGLGARTGAVHQKCADGQGEAQNDCSENCREAPHTWSVLALSP